MNPILPAVITTLSLPLGQFGGGGGSQLPASGGVSTVWLVIAGMAIVSILTVILCFWFVWRMRQLSRALKSLAEKQGETISIPGAFGFLPRFSMRTLLILVTLAAIVLGMFGGELSRARRQGQILDAFDASGELDYYDSVHFRLGWLGESYLAGLLCDWVHPHFSCRLTHLTISYDTYGDPLPRRMNTTKYENLRSLRDLEALQITFANLGQADIEVIASLPRLRKLSLRDCHLPKGALEVLAKLDGLEVLDLDDCGLWDDDLKGLETLKQLTHLSLAKNEISDEGLKLVSALERLRVLNLQKTNIGDDGLNELLAMEQLTDLDLAETELSQEAIRSFLDSTDLRYVNLYQVPADFIASETLQRENKRLKIDWRRPADRSEEWRYEDNRPSGPRWSSGSVGGFGTPPPTAGGGQF